MKNAPDVDRAVTLETNGTKLTLTYVFNFGCVDNHVFVQSWQQAPTMRVNKRA